jgi:predicted CoA-binding protein
MQRAPIEPNWQDIDVIERLVRESRSVAVVGCSPDPERASHGVARYLHDSGLRVLPVNPRITAWHGLAVYPSVSDLPEAPDIVDVFRRPEFVPEIAEQAVAIGAGALWLQMGVISERGARIAAGGGLDVVMDRCLMVEHREVVGWS